MSAPEPLPPPESSFEAARRMTRLVGSLVVSLLVREGNVEGALDRLAEYGERSGEGLADMPTEMAEDARAVLMAGAEVAELPASASSEDVQAVIRKWRP